MAKVKLPPGCVGFDTADGRKLTANRPGGTLDVSDKDAGHINASQFAEQGFITATDAQSFGTKRGMRCVPCNRLWNAWNTTCHRCGSDTIPD